MPETEDRKTRADAPDDYRKRERTRQIYEAREHAAEKIRQADAMEIELRQRAGGDEASYLVNLAVRRAVEHLLYEIEPLLRGSDTGQRYWRGIELGEIEAADGHREVVGFVEYLSLDDPVVIESGSGNLELNRDGQLEAQTTTERRQVPREVSITAYRAANAFLQDVGLGFRNRTATPGGTDGL